MSTLRNHGATPEGVSDSAPAKQLLIIEDDPDQAAYLTQLVKFCGWQSTTAATGAAAEEAQEAHPCQLILLDIYLPDINGIDLLKKLRESADDVTVIAMTSQSTTELAVEAMRQGAYDFLEKPLSLERLRVTLENALEHQTLTSTLHDYERNFKRDHFHNMLGSSLAMQNVFRIIESAAPSKATVLDRKSVV